MTSQPIDTTRRPTITFARSPTGRGFRLEACQFLPHLREEIFAFFSDAFQLQTLTPSSVHFAVITPPPIRLEQGAVIDYRLRIHGVPLGWRSLISYWEPPLRFVDEQLKGPYRRWHHEHAFESVAGGTLCRDLVDYEVPGGSLVNLLFVRPDLRRIFAFRQQKLAELFR